MTYMETHYGPEKEWAHNFIANGWCAIHGDECTAARSTVPRRESLPDVPPACPVRMPSWMREMARDGDVLPPLFTMSGVWD